jgi:WD40 repeat protein
MERGCWLPPVWSGPQYIRFPPLSDRPSYFFKKRVPMHSSAISLQVQGHESGLRTLPHSSSITSVDWHPTLPMYITGSADHSVRVTSILWSIKQSNRLEILSMSQCNRRYYCLKGPVKLLVTTCFPASKHPFLSTVLTLWEAFWCHGIFCMEELCLCLVAALYPMVSFPTFFVVKQKQV